MIFKDGQLLHEPSVRETTKRWMALHFSVEAEGADWVTEPKGGHQEGQPNFHDKVFVVDCPPLPFPTVVDNIVTWD